ncbi:unnamed protein product, partial [Amoebophrya sp. A120]|eukprot:GSA120T00016965001.1
MNVQRRRPLGQASWYVRSARAPLSSARKNRLPLRGTPTPGRILSSGAAPRRWLSRRKRSRGLGATQRAWRRRARKCAQGSDSCISRGRSTKRPRPRQICRAPCFPRAPRPFPARRPKN